MLTLSFLPQKTLKLFLIRPFVTDGVVVLLFLPFQDDDDDEDDEDDQFTRVHKSHNTRKVERV